MIKRLGKAKKRKQGAILIMVVVILALALIFISSAMLLTKATRSRLYENSLTSQARLTVTSAAEVFLEALETQEITDKQMDGFLSESPSKNDGEMKMVINGVPGMSTAEDNCTKLNIYYPDKTSKPNVVYCDFSTTIGDQTESVRVELSIQPADETKPSDRFSNQIDQYQAAGDSRFFFEGGIGAVRNSEVKPTDNTVLLRNGNSTTTASGGKFYSDMVFAEDAVWNGDSAAYHGDLIFLGESYVRSQKSLDKEFTGNVYFIGSTNKPGFRLFPGSANWENLWSSFKPQNMVFAGRTVVEDDESNHISKLVGVTEGSEHVANCYFVGKNGTTVTGVAKTSDGTGYDVPNKGGTLPEDLDKKYNIAKEYNYSSTGNVFPTDIVNDVFKKMNPDGEVMIAGDNTVLEYDTFSADGTKNFPKNVQIAQGEKYVVNPLTQYYPSYKKVDGAIPDSSKIVLCREGSLGTLDKADGTTDRIIDLAPGYYYLQPGTYEGGRTLKDVNDGTGTSDDLKLTPYVIAIDGSQGGDYRFYFAPGTYELNCLVFAIYNPTNLEPVVFILEPGAHVNWGGTDNKWHNDSALCATGIISIDRKLVPAEDETQAHKIGTYVQTTKMATEVNGGTDQYAFSEFYDSKVRPSAYLFGSCTGTSETYVEWGAVNSIFEAYIGLYGEKSTLKTKDGNYNVWIYGRIETYNVDNYNTSCHNYYMPYCPGPANNSEPLPDERPAETKYKVAAITYYYGTGVTEGT